MQLRNVENNSRFLKTIPNDFKGMTISKKMKESFLIRVASIARVISSEISSHSLDISKKLTMSNYPNKGFKLGGTSRLQIIFQGEFLKSKRLNEEL